MRLPSLNALRALEAVARLGSVARAADALSVTPSAVSHQIKLLEEDLGLALLQREGRGLAPTPELQAGLEALREGFASLAAGVEAIRQAAERPRLTVSVVPSFGTWLVPRLDRFWEREPTADVRLVTKWEISDFRRDGIDVAIRFGPGGYKGSFEHRLIDEEYSPVCSPALLEGPSALRTPEDLSRFVLLHVEGAYLGPDFPTWKMWLTAVGVADRVDYRRGPQFIVSDLALRAARDGKGVALGASALVADDIAAGLLVRPFQHSLPAPHAYHIVCPPEHLRRPMVQRFITWLKEEAAPYSRRSAAPSRPESGLAR